MGRRLVYLSYSYRWGSLEVLYRPPSEFRPVEPRLARRGPVGSHAAPRPADVESAGNLHRESAPIATALYFPPAPVSLGLQVGRWALTAACIPPDSPPRRDPLSQGHPASLLCRRQSEVSCRHSKPSRAPPPTPNLKHPPPHRSRRSSQPILYIRTGYPTVLSPMVEW